MVGGHRPRSRSRFPIVIADNDACAGVHRVAHSHSRCPRARQTAGATRSGVAAAAVAAAESKSRHGDGTL